MEIRINKEIRSYTESVFFGLSLRQFVFSLLAAGVAVGLYFLLRSHLGLEILSWVCVLGAVPFAVLGFVSYHGMPAEQLIWVWLRFAVLEPRQLKFETINPYCALLAEGKRKPRQARQQCKPHRPRRANHKAKSKTAKGNSNPHLL